MAPSSPGSRPRNNKYEEHIETSTYFRKGTGFAVAYFEVSYMDPPKFCSSYLFVYGGLPVAGTVFAPWVGCPT